MSRSTLVLSVSVGSPSADDVPCREPRRPWVMGSESGRVAPSSATSAPPLWGVDTVLHGDPMLRLALLFLVGALLAAVLGFGALGGTAAWIARLSFFLCLAVFVVAIIAQGEQPA